MRIMTVEELRTYASKIEGMPFDIDQVGQYLFVWMVNVPHHDCRTDYLYRMVEDLDAITVASWNRPSGAKRKEWVRILKVPITTFLFPPLPVGLALKSDNYTLYVRIPKHYGYSPSTPTLEHWTEIFGGVFLEEKVPETDDRILKTRLEFSAPYGLFELTTASEEQLQTATPIPSAVRHDELRIDNNGWKEHIQLLAKAIGGKFYRSVLAEIASALGYEDFPWDTPPEDIRVDSATDQFAECKP